MAAGRELVWLALSRGGGWRHREAKHTPLCGGWYAARSDPDLQIEMLIGTMGRTIARHVDQGRTSELPAAPEPALAMAGGCATRRSRSWPRSATSA